MFENGGYVLPAKDAPTSGGNQAPQNQAKKKKVYPVIPAGQIVPVEVVQVAEVPLPEGWIKEEDDTTTEISFHFKVTSGQWEGTHIWGRTRPWFNWSPKCRFRLWIQAILGTDDLPEGFRLEPTAEVDRQGRDIKVFHVLDGMRCQVAVDNYTTKATQELRHIVNNVLPNAQYDENPF